jgi:hypothetical protein
MKNILTLITAVIVSFNIFSQEKHDIKASIGGIHEGKMSAQDIVKAGKIDVNDKEFQVIKFDMSFVMGDGSMIHKSKSNKMTEEMIKEINSLPHGTKLYFESIEANDKSGKVIKVPSVVLMLE